jgi:hypothetical protein
MVAPAQAQLSASCTAVNSGAFNLTDTSLGPLSSSSLISWFVGDQITLTLTSSNGISRTDGFYNGSFAALQTTTVPTTGSVNLTYTVVSTDLTNGILVDPENNDSVTATCTAGTPAPTISGVSPNTGLTAGGTVVSITGTNLTGATAVNFGANAATSVMVNSATSVTATSPAGSAGVVDVTVTTPGGTSATSAADQFTYIAPPTVTAVSPNKGPTGGGTVVSITGTNLTGATAVNFGGNAATSMTVNSATLITATSPAGSAGVVDITVITPGGTSATSAADQFTYFARPTVTAVSPTSGVTTGGATVTITGTNLNGATAVSFGGVAATINADAANSITATSPAHSAGKVDVTVMTPGGTSATSAADQFTYQLPTRTWVSGLGNDSNACSRTAPCQTFAAALAQTAAGGEIDVLDPGDFGAVTITKAITLDGGGSEFASIPTSGTSGITISAASTDVVILRNLQFNGTGSGGAEGVAINSAAMVIIEKCDIFGFGTAAILVATSATSSSTIIVQETTIKNNGAGISVKPTGGTVKIALELTHVDNNTNAGMRVDGTGGGAVNAAISDSSISLNGAAGLNVLSGTANVAVDVQRAVIADNGGAGVSSSNTNGGTAIVTVGDSILSNNGTAWSIVGSATLQGYQNNQVTGPIGTPPSQAFFQ